MRLLLQEGNAMDITRSALHEQTFERIAQKNIEVSGFVNIGSGRGDDTAFYLRRWPQMRSLLIDMDSRFEENWRKLAETLPNVQHVVCAAGAEDGEGAFVKTNQVGGALVSSADNASDTKQTPVCRIDTLVERYNIPPPYFLKFDTHGVELEILAGAEETLKRTHLIMMEVYNFKLRFVGFRNLTFDEMSLHMKELGFRCVDLCDPLFRPGDLALWQMHMIFIRSDHPLWSRTSYSAG